ncbi:MAG: chemotaxis protein CheR, partial [SAR324 cluster bacterium]|nr:chemotaxis protein CheR [SAR324 cluster bacterium]
AACSSGEEAYTLAMLLKEFLAKTTPRWDIGILATDIDSEKLQEAHKGIYTSDRMKNIPPMYKTNYFQALDKTKWQVRPQLKQLIHFSNYNLIRPKFVFKSKFYAIFCRNVMIYFDRATITALVQRFYEVTEDYGFLFIGQTENLDKDKCPYRYVAPAIYQKIPR